MAHRPKPRYASKDPHQGPWTTCSRCGFIWSGAAMRFQFDYLGGPTPQNTGVLVCPKCEDSLDINNKLLILPPDPAPFRNTRPYPYAIDEGFSPDQEIGIQLIINFVMAAAVDVSGLAPGVPGAWLFDDPDQSSEMLTAGLM